MTARNDFTKDKFSGSTDGKPIQVSGTATGSSNTIHTAVAGTTQGTLDEIWLYAYNSSASPVLLTLEFGDATLGTMKYTVPAQNGLVLLIPGLVLQNGLTVKAWAATTNVIFISGFVNKIIHTP